METVIGIERKLEDYYGDFKEPSFSKLDNGYLPLHHKITIDLTKEFYVNDTTDQNSDVSTSLVLLDQDLEWYISLYLSYIGKYAALIFDREFVFNEHSSIPNIKKILMYLEKYDFLILDKSTLVNDINIVLSYSNRPKIFNALFSDIDTIP